MIQQHVYCHWWIPVVPLPVVESCMQVPWKIIVCLRWADNLKNSWTNVFWQHFEKCLRNSRETVHWFRDKYRRGVDCRLVWWLNVLPLVLWVVLFYWENFDSKTQFFSQQKLLNHYYVFSTRSACLWLLWIMNVNRFLSTVRARPRSERTECRSGDSLNTHALSAYSACCQQNVFQIIETQQCPAVGLPRTSIQQRSCRHIKALKSKWHNTIKSSNILSLRIVFFGIFWNNMHTDEFLLVSIVNCWNQWAHCLLRSRQLTLGLSQSFA